MNHLDIWNLSSFIVMLNMIITDDDVLTFISVPKLQLWDKKHSQLKNGSTGTNMLSACCDLWPQVFYLFMYYIFYYFPKQTCEYIHMNLEDTENAIY